MHLTNLEKPLGICMDFAVNIFYNKIDMWAHIPELNIVNNVRNAKYRLCMVNNQQRRKVTWLTKIE